MCGMCSDYVVSCWTCTQPMRGSKTGARMGRQYFLMDTLCLHFVERYKTDSASMYDHIRIEHSMEDEDYNDYWVYECDDNCVTEGWWSAELVTAVVDAFNEWGEA